MQRRKSNIDRKFDLLRLMFPSTLNKKYYTQKEKLQEIDIYITQFYRFIRVAILKKGGSVDDQKVIPHVEYRKKKDAISAREKPVVGAVQRKPESIQ